MTRQQKNMKERLCDILTMDYVRLDGLPKYRSFALNIAIQTAAKLGILTDTEAFDGTIIVNKISNRKMDWYSFDQLIKFQFGIHNPNALSTISTPAVETAATTEEKETSETF